MWRALHRHVWARRGQLCSLENIVRVMALKSDDEFLIDGLNRLATTTRNEADLTGQRMTWLMSLNGFIFAGLSLLLVNRSQIQSSSPGTFLLLVAVAADAGLVSNLSTIYSNYWADRATREADVALSAHVLLNSDANEYRDLFRLAGRDPEHAPSFRGTAVSFWSPPGNVLHSWFLLPGVFALLFAAAPLAVNAGHRGVAVGSWLPQLCVIAVLALTLCVSVRSGRRDQAERSSVEAWLNWLDLADRLEIRPVELERLPRISRLARACDSRLHGDPKLLRQNFLEHVAGYTARHDLQPEDWADAGVDVATGDPVANARSARQQQLGGED